MKYPIDCIVVRQISLPLRDPFVTSYGPQNNRDHIILELHGEGLVGYGECALLLEPFYNHETIATALHVLQDFLIPLSLKKGFTTIEELNSIISCVIGHPITKGGLEMAFWDWKAKSMHIPLRELVGGEKTEIPVGISVGIPKEMELLKDLVADYLAKGYQRIKIKIKPGFDVKPLKYVRINFPDITLMADANSAYTVENFLELKELDELNLLMIEQPLSADNLYGHAVIQSKFKTPICLDESIESFEDAQSAIALGSCKIINIKPGRSSGFAQSIAIHDYAQKHNIGVWCGGMLETGVGKAALLALSSLPNFIYPADIAESIRYADNDIIEPMITVSSSGTIPVPTKPGIGVEVHQDQLERITVYKNVFKP